MTQKLKNHLQKENEKALARYIQHNQEISSMLARLLEASENHFEVHPEDVNWGHASELADLKAGIKELCDRVFHEGEYK